MKVNLVIRIQYLRVVVPKTLKAQRRIRLLTRVSRVARFVDDQKLILDEKNMGQLPVWAHTQLQQALDQLFRTNLIR
jgi:hypothetical protein